VQNGIIIWHRKMTSRDTGGMFTTRGCSAVSRVSRVTFGCYVLYSTVVALLHSWNCNGSCVGAAVPVSPKLSPVAIRCRCLDKTLHTALLCLSIEEGRVYSASCSVCHSDMYPSFTSLASLAAF
jgi:hypothetical protein